jgi:hypothetical protein
MIFTSDESQLLMGMLPWKLTANGSLWNTMALEASVAYTASFIPNHENIRSTVAARLTKHASSRQRLCYSEGLIQSCNEKIKQSVGDASTGCSCGCDYFT